MTEEAEEREGEELPANPEPLPVPRERIGKILERARLEKKLTVDDVDEITRISPGWIQVIEQGTWTQYPSMVYAKGHVKLYAQLLGLNVNELMEHFTSEWNEMVKVDPHENGTLQTQSGVNVRQSGNSPNYLAWGGGVVLLLLGLAVGSKYVMSDHEPREEKQSLVQVNPAPIPPPPAPAPQPTDDKNAISNATAPSDTAQKGDQLAVRSESNPLSETSHAGVQGPKKTQGKSNPPAIVKDGLTLRLVALKSEWVVVGVDDGIVHRFRLNPGDSRVVLGRNFMTLSAQYGDGVVLFLNGRRLGFAGQNADPVLRRRINRLSLRPLHNQKKSAPMNVVKKGNVQGAVKKVGPKSPAVGGKAAAKPKPKVIPLIPTPPQQNQGVSSGQQF